MQILLQDQFIMLIIRRSFTRRYTALSRHFSDSKKSGNDDDQYNIKKWNIVEEDPIKRTLRILKNDVKRPVLKVRLK